MQFGRIASLLFLIYFQAHFVLPLQAEQRAILPTEPPKNTTPSKPQKSRLAVVEDPSLVRRFHVDGARAADAFERALTTYTQSSNAKEAWLKLIEPTDVVAIHVTCPGNPMLAVPMPIIERMISGLKKAGVQQENILVWDKTAEAMIASGYAPHATVGDWQIQAVIGNSGFDPKVFYFNEVVGKLIWGDLEFVGAKEQSIQALLQKAAGEKEDSSNPSSSPSSFSLGNPKQPQEQISNRSFFAKIITQKANKIIHLSIASDHPDVGIWGACSSLALASVDNSRRFTTNGIAGDPAVGEILNHAALKKKVVLHVMSGFLAQFAGGPDFEPHYCESPGLLLVSQDPVAIDTLILERFEAWRKERIISPIGENARHLKSATQLGVGHPYQEQSKVDIVNVR